MVHGLAGCGIGHYRGEIMLMTLSIHNVVLIKRLEISFARGLSVLTGETGAGKSILLDALGLALGARSDSNLLRLGSEQATVIAEFSACPGDPPTTLLHENDIEHDGIILLRRVLGMNGRTRAFVNDQPVSINFLRRVGESLVEIQGQFDERGLMDQNTHHAILDAFGNHQEMVMATRASFLAMKDANTKLVQAKAVLRKVQEDEEYLRHSADELIKLNPVLGEETELTNLRQLLTYSEKILSAANEAFTELEGESGAENKLRKALSSLERCSKIAGDSLKPAINIIERALIDTEEAMANLRDTADGVDLDGKRLEKIEDRLHALRDAARKHRVEVDALPELKNMLESKVSLINDQSDHLVELQQSFEAARKNFINRASDLRQERYRSGHILDNLVNEELIPLKFEKASFETRIEELPEQQWGETGMDSVSFLVSTNPGTPSGPLSKIASGGELSRFMLALRVVVTAKGGPDTLIFDEVDSGIGGATADAVGARLADLAQKLQILVVTHSPQVAARGNSHFKVAKYSTSEDTVTNVQELFEEEKCEEVARMLSGKEVTNEARAAASKLLQEKNS